MKNYIQKWKSLNKNGLKLSLICGLNWLIGFVAKNQFYLFTSALLGLLTYYMSREFQVFTVNILALIVLLKVIVDAIQAVLSKVRRIKKSLLLGVMYLFFLVGNAYIKQHALTEFLVNRLFTLWISSLVLANLIIFIQPRLFKVYLFKNVLNKT